MQLSVILLGTDPEQQAILQMQVDATAIAKTALSLAGFPVAATDPLIRKIQDCRPDVVIVDIPKQAAGDGVRTIELLHSELRGTAVFALGETTQAQVIIAAMRAGAKEYLERPTSTTALLEAVVRLTSSQRKTDASDQRGKSFSFLNTRGGAGATTMAVNTAVQLGKSFGSAVLVDLAPVPHTALHLNLRPVFTIIDALDNIQRLDPTLLATYLTPAPNGLQVLAGLPEPSALDAHCQDLARLFDVLITNFRHVVVDLSSRLDRSTKLICDLSDQVLLVAQPEVTSLWSAARIHDFLGDTPGGDRVRLLLNRFRKVPGLSDSDIERATRATVIGRIPNDYELVAKSIDRGTPVAQENHSEIARAFVGLSTSLTGRKNEKSKRGFSLFGAGA